MHQTKLKGNDATTGREGERRKRTRATIARRLCSSFLRALLLFLFLLSLSLLLDRLSILLDVVEHGVDFASAVVHNGLLAGGLEEDR